MEVHERKIEIEVAYALPENQLIRCLDLPPGTTAEQAVELSGITSLFPEIDLSRNKLGIFGTLVDPGTILHDGDRVEIYRPLVVDPKESRRKRAKEFSSARKIEA
jgi:putative ubiquitin-RnfH superfamily antitoxin RatB of RatAB toxin-antitoxin module